ncbi:MAG: flavin reductase family protein [Acidimicrobiia bacterium]
MPEEFQITEQNFRDTLSYYPTGVSAVCALWDNQPVGMTIGSFFSISLDPPLVGLSVRQGSGTWPKIAEAGVFAVNVLAENQRHIAAALAASGDDKFGDIGWHSGVTGSPLVEGSLAHVECVIDQTLPVGDHWIVVGRVVNLDTHPEADHKVEPMLFYRRGYGTFEERS